MKLQERVEFIDKILEKEGLTVNERDSFLNENFDLLLSEYASPITELSKGQLYAVNFLKSLGLEFISTPLQISRGTLEFMDKQSDLHWQISNTGYLRKKNHIEKGDRNTYYGGHEWQMFYSHFPPQYGGEKRFLSDDEYMDMAEKLSEKIRKSRKPKSQFRQSKVNDVFKVFKEKIEYIKSGGERYEWHGTTDLEIQEAIKKLAEKYIK